MSRAEARYSAQHVSYVCKVIHADSDPSGRGQTSASDRGGDHDNFRALSEFIRCEAFQEPTRNQAAAAVADNVEVLGQRAQLGCEVEGVHNWADADGGVIEGQNVIVFLRGSL